MVRLTLKIFHDLHLLERFLKFVFDHFGTLRVKGLQILLKRYEKISLTK